MQNYHWSQLKDIDDDLYLHPELGCSLRVTSPLHHEELVVSPAPIFVVGIRRSTSPSFSVILICLLMVCKFYFKFLLSVYFILYLLSAPDLAVCHALFLVRFGLCCAPSACLSVLSVVRPPSFVIYLVFRPCLCFLYFTDPFVNSCLTCLHISLKKIPTPL